MRHCPSPNFDQRPAGCAIDALILHYTGMPSAGDALARLCDPAAKVSAHWLIDEDGTVVALVPEAMRAWHAGVSCWQGREGLNDCSIGIELVNPGHEWGYRPFTEAQYRACVGLCRGILARWPIPPGRVLAHSDIAPARKQDPGELFDWRRLAAERIGLWPEEGCGLARPVATLRRDLALVGYQMGPGWDLDGSLRDVIRAFQRHFRPERVDGDPDSGTLARLDGLLALLALQTS